MKRSNLEEIFNCNRLTTRLFHESINYIVFWSRWLISLSLRGFTTSWGFSLFREKCLRFLAKTRRKGEEWLVQSSNLRECTFISVYTVNSCDLVRHCVTRIFHRTGRGMNGDKSFERDRSFAPLRLGHFRIIFTKYFSKICFFPPFGNSFLATIELWNSCRTEIEMRELGVHCDIALIRFN